MSIRTKLLFSFLLLTLLLITHFIVNYYFIQKEHALVKEMVNEHNISLQLSELAIAAQKIRRYEKEYFIYVQNTLKRRKYFKEFSEAKQEINKVLFGLKRTYLKVGKEQELSQLTDWETATLAYTKGFDRVNAEVLAGNISEVIQANSAIKEAKNKFRPVLSGSSDAIDKSYKLAKAKAELIEEFSKTSSLVSSVIALTSVFIGLIMAFQVPASISRPLKELTDIATGISKGKFYNSMEDIKGSPEIVDLSKSIERLQTATLGLLKRIQSGRRQEAVSGAKA